MAEPTGDYAELDSRLRDALGQAAQSGDSTGVADAIRSRVAAGDPGTSVAASTAPGWGGGVFSWLPWVGLIAVLGIVGASLGVTGVFGSPREEVVAGYSVVLDDSAPAYSCPGGARSGSLPAGARVLAVARSDDSAWLGVRDPNAFARTLWFPRSVVIVDDGQADVASLPVEACPEAIVELITPTPTPEPQETQAPPPPPAADTTAPSIGAIGVQSSNCYFLVTAPVSDNVGVAGVSISWSGVPNGESRAMTPQGGGVWRLEVSGSSNVYGGNYTFTVTATDGAGNSTQRVSSPANIQCLI